MFVGFYNRSVIVTYLGVIFSITSMLRLSYQRDQLNFIVVYQ